MAHLKLLLLPSRSPSAPSYERERAFPDLQPARQRIAVPLSHLRKLWRILGGILRELADESAYERHLAHHGRLNTSQEWRRFSEERLRQKYQRPRCC